MNLDNLTSVGGLEIQLAEQVEYERQIEKCMERKRVLYEKLVSREISLEDYKKEKAGIDADLDRWKNLRAALAAQTAQARMDEAARNERMALAEEVAGAHSLTAELVDKLIDRVYIHPDKQIEIAWKIEDFCAS